MTAHRKLTQAELLAEATARFGRDPMGWAFRCPACGDVATGQDFKNALAAHPGKHSDGRAVRATDIIGQECIGRTLGALRGRAGSWKGRGCDWAAYGLFRGPWEIVLPDGRSMWCFPLAPADLPARADDSTCGDCATGRCHGEGPDDCGCDRHNASAEATP